MELQDLSQRLRNISTNSGPYTSINWLELAKEVQRMILEARIDELEYAQEPSTSYMGIIKKRSELKQQLSELK